MPVDHLIEFNDLMPDRLEMELINTGDLPLTAMGLEKPSYAIPIRAI
jgi:hypothetical protein